MNFWMFLTVSQFYQSIYFDKAFLSSHTHTLLQFQVVAGSNLRYGDKLSLDQFKLSLKKGWYKLSLGWVSKASDNETKTLFSKSHNIF